MTIENMRDDLADVYAGSAEREGPSIAAMMKAGAGPTITRAHWQATRQALADMLARYDRMTPACRSCVYLDGAGWCAVWEAKPPEEFKSAGCERWEFDGVPF